ncbi:MAG: Stk1 family PASTA domain-containing Ser/Thr kinase [Bacillota bacterium]
MIGRILANRYKIVEKIGGGGMAEVFKGLDLLLDRQVTVKILREQYTSDGDFVRRFRREAQAVARLSHPNVVSIYDVGTEGQLQYLVMEYVEGTNLKELVSGKGPIAQEQVISIGIQICDALEHAHSNQIIHRDIKPHNILITKSGRVKVTDFGIAKAVSEATVTYTGGMIGSVHYLSPEQAKGEITDHKSDIYSTGVVLYELATGEVPYKGESPITIALKHIQDFPKKPREIDPTISQELEEVILKAMARDKEKRYANTTEMKNSLEKINRNADYPRSIKRHVPQTKASKKLKPLAWFLLAAFFIGLIIGAAVLVKDLLIVEEVEVPNVIGRSLTDAGILLEKAGLRVELGVERYHPTIPANHIVEQNPKRGQVVRKGRAVKLEVSLGQRQVEVPDVVGELLRIARIKIENANLVVEEPIEEIYSNEQPEGRVVAQIPLGNSLQDEGTPVKLVVSKGAQPQNILMPDLRGHPLAEAEQILKENRLDLGIISYQESTIYFTGQVVSQDIEPGENVIQGSTVNLVVSRGPGPKAMSATVRFRIVDDGQEHVIKIVVEDLKGTRQEYLQRHQPGDRVETTVPFYGKGKVKIYQDDVLLYEEPLSS